MKSITRKGHSASVTTIPQWRIPKRVILKGHPTPQHHNEVNYRDVLLTAAKDEQQELADEIEK